MTKNTLSHRTHASTQSYKHTHTRAKRHANCRKIEDIDIRNFESVYSYCDVSIKFVCLLLFWCLAIFVYIVRGQENRWKHWVENKSTHTHVNTLKLKYLTVFFIFFFFFSFFLLSHLVSVCLFCTHFDGWLACSCLESIDWSRSALKIHAHTHRSNHHKHSHSHNSNRSLAACNVCMPTSLCCGVCLSEWNWK